ncbi:MAG: DUF2125 domain-containing protein [Alphaproteobacteria bacterium]|nr:DUF2125 domain-containing protein [Alphaproteobacteria bacterium]
MSINLRFGLIIGAIFLVLAGYTGYWFFAAGRVETEIQRWLADKEAAGYEIEYSELRVSGFPYRFEIHLSNPQIQLPESDGGWFVQLDAVQANALPYDFSLWIVAFDGPFLVEGDQTLRIDASDARFSRKSNSGGEIIRVGAEINALTIEALDGEPPNISGIEQLLIAGQVGDDNILRVQAEASGLRASQERLDPGMAAAFGETGELARMAMEVTEWSELAREGDAARWSRAGGEIRVEEAVFNWGPAQLTGEGQLTVNEIAEPDGRLSVRIANPDALADALVEGGLIEEENEQALRLAVMLAPRSEEGVSLPFSITASGVFFGPVRITSFEN